MKNKKGIKNTIAGCIFFVGFIAILIVYLSTSMNVESFAIAATTWTAACKFINDLLSKDANKSHTQK